MTHIQQSTKTQKEIPMERKTLRALLDAMLLNDSDFTAFCSDNFYDIYRRFSDRMDRVQKATILLDYADHSIIINHLRALNPKRVSYYEETPGPNILHMHGLSEFAIRIATERPAHWEYRLLSQVLSDELSKLYLHKKDSDLDITFKEAVIIQDGNYFTWASARMHSIVRFASNFSKLFNVTLKEALGEPGHAGDPNAIFYVSRRIADAYRAAIDWGLEWKRISHPEELSGLFDVASKYGKGIVIGIEDFERQLRCEIAQIGTHYDAVVKISLTLSLPEHAEEEFQA